MVVTVHMLSEVLKGMLSALKSWITHYTLYPVSGEVALWLPTTKVLTSYTSSIMVCGAVTHFGNMLHTAPCITHSPVSVVLAEASLVAA